MNAPPGLAGLLLTLCIGCAAPAPPPVSPTGTSAQDAGPDFDDPEVVWAAFTERVASSSAVRAFVVHTTPPDPWGQTRVIQRAVTVSTDGKAAMDGTGWPGARSLLIDGIAREAVNGEWQGDPQPMPRMAALARIFFHGLDGLPRTAIGPNDPGPRDVAGGVAFYLALDSGGTAELGFSEGELVDVRLRFEGEPILRFQVYELSFDPPIPPGFFEPLGAPPDESMLSTLSELITGCVPD